MTPKSRGGGGKLSRRAAIALISGGGLLGLSGTGAFSQVDSNRVFDVATASDENALLGIKTTGVEFTQIGQTKTILQLKNQTDSTITLDPKDGVEKNTIHNFLSIIKYPREIKPADDSDNPEEDWVDVKANIIKKRNNQNPVELTINAVSEETTISAVRTLTVRTDVSQSLPSGCPIGPNVTVSVADAQGTVTNPGSLQGDVDGDVLISNGNDFDITSASTINISGKIAGSSTGNIKIQNDNVGESIISSPGKNVEVKGISSVGGEIIAGGGITVKGKNQSNQAVVSGNIEAGKIDQIQDAVIGGNVIINGGGEIQRAKIGGEIQTGSGNDVSIKDSTVCGIVRSDGNAKIKQGSQIKGVRTTTGGKNIRIKNGSEVSQNIHLKGSGEVIIKNKSVVKGNITANNGTVTVQGTVEGNITAQKITINGNGTVQGNMTEI